MSCRIIGRNIEYAFFDYLVDELKNKKIKYIKADYIYSPKNQQTKSLYKKFGFNQVEEKSRNISFLLELKNYKKSNKSYIKVLNE